MGGHYIGDAYTVSCWRSPTWHPSRFFAFSKTITLDEPCDPHPTVETPLPPRGWHFPCRRPRELHDDRAPTMPLTRLTNLWTRFRCCDWSPQDRGNAMSKWHAVLMYDERSCSLAYRNLVISNFVGLLVLLWSFVKINQLGSVRVLTFSKLIIGSTVAARSKNNTSRIEWFCVEK